MTHREMRDFLLLARAFRRTPIVDDDFVLMRDRFDFALEDMLRRADAEFPKVITLCGSTRFKSVWYEQTKRLTHEGWIVLGVGDLNPNAPDTNDPIDPELKARLDALHLRKIDMADEVLILNAVGGKCARCGRFCFQKWCPDCSCSEPVAVAPYIGESTRRELAHARAAGKVIRFLNPEPTCPSSQQN